MQCQNQVQVIGTLKMVLESGSTMPSSAGILTFLTQSTSQSQVAIVFAGKKSEAMSDHAVLLVEMMSIMFEFFEDINFLLRSKL